MAYDINTTMTSFTSPSSVAITTNGTSSMVSNNITTDVPVTMSIVSDVNNMTSQNDGNHTDETCVDWRQAQGILFQMGCLALAIGYLIPHTLTHHVILSRAVLSMGPLLLVLWAGTVVCQQDVLLWYIVLCLINLGHSGYWLYRHWPVTIHADMEDTYTKLFKPVHMSPKRFQELAAIGQIKDLPGGASYAVEGATKIGVTMSILLAGRLKVTCDNLFLHSIEPCQFVDSVEYDALVPDAELTECFQVSVRAVDDSRLVTWDMDTLRHFLEERPYFRSVVTNLIGKDITHKLYQVQEMLLSHPQYLRVLDNRNSVHLSQNMHQGYSPHGSNPNGILRPSSPPDSCCSSSTGSRHAVSQSQIFLTPPIHVRSSSQRSLETCV